MQEADFLFALRPFVVFGSFKTMYISPIQKRFSSVDDGVSLLAGSLSQMFLPDVGRDGGTLSVCEEGGMCELSVVSAQCIFSHRFPFY